jgi:hypothetical protein
VAAKTFDEWVHDTYSFVSPVMVGILKPCWEAATEAVEAHSAAPNTPSDEIADYDCGMLNDHGGGNVAWWWDYLRYEIGRCNDYWRSATSHVG